ncbi:ABC-three component system protein [Pseudomonas fluorescens]
MIHDATPSWSGYNYQGKVAIHYALCHIIDKIGTDPLHTFQGDSIVLENHEDFELFVNGVLVSFHQVKAYAEQNFGSYDEALFGLALNLYSRPGPAGYIHTWKAINLPAGKSLQAAISEFIKKLVDEHEAAPATSTIFKAVNLDPKRNKTARIIGQAFGGLTVAKINTALKLILANPALALSRIQSYLYGGNPCCSIDDINELIKSKLKEVLVLKGGVNTAKQIDSVFHHLLERLDIYVTQRHLNKQNAGMIHIDMLDILAIVDSDFDDVSSEYMAIKFKERFFYLFDEFMNNPEYYTVPDDLDDFVCNLSQIRYSLLSVKPDKLFAYYKNFSPVIRFEGRANIEQAFLVNENGIMDVLLKVFNSLDFQFCENDSSQNKLVYRSKVNPMNYYLPTTINDKSSTKIARALIANTRIVEDLYEVNHLIYDGPQIVSLYDRLDRHTSPPQLVGVEEREPRDEYFGRLQLIPIQQAMDELNAD